MNGSIPRPFDKSEDRWINQCGYTLTPTMQYSDGGWLFGKHPVWEFTLSHAHPLTFWSARWRCYIQPDAHGYTDFGTVPWCVGWLRTYAVRAYIMHDSACRERVLYFATDPEKPFTPQHVSSVDAAALLSDGVAAERGNVRTARLIGRYVRRFGPQWE